MGKNREKSRDKTGKRNVCNINTERKGRGMNQTENLKGWKEFIREEDGMGTVEIILIIVVLVGLVILFKDQITKIVNDLFAKITKQTGKI